MALQYKQYIQNPELLRGLQNVQNEPVKYFPINSPIQNAEPQYINQAITMPTEKVPTVDESNQNYTGAKYQIFRDNFPTPSPREFNLQNQIYEQKLLYDEAQKKYAKATTNDDKTMYKNIMEDATTNANVLRNTAQNLGWSTKGFDANNTLGDAVQMMNLNRNRGMAEFADMPSTSAQKRQVYEQMLDRGVAPHLARAVAESYHDEFREKNINRLVEGIGAYGMNADGSLNEFGQMMMGKLYNESPYAYGNIANGFANPKDVFGVNANLAQATMNNDSAMQRTLVQTKSAENIANDKLQQQEKQFGLKYNLDIARLNLDVNKAETDQAYKAAQLKQAESDMALKTPEGRYFGYLRLGKLHGLSDEDAANLAFRLTTNDGSEDKTTLARKSVEQAILNQFKIVRRDLEKGDMESANNQLAGINELIRDIKSKEAGLMTEDSIDAILNLQDVYSQVISGTITYEEAKKLIGRYQPSNYRGENDQALADRMNNPEKHHAEINAALGKSEENNNAAEQKRQNADKSAQINETVGRTGIYMNPNPEQREFNITPKITQNSDGQLIVTNWEELDPGTRIKLRQEGYTSINKGGKWYAVHR